jgi:hypothetical protein
MCVRKWIARREEERACCKLLREPKSGDKTFYKKFVFIRLFLFPTPLRHFVLVGTEGFKFVLQINKQITITTPK